MAYRLLFMERPRYVEKQNGEATERRRTKTIATSAHLLRWFRLSSESFVCVEKPMPYRQYGKQTERVNSLTDNMRLRFICDVV